MSAHNYTPSYKNSRVRQGLSGPCELIVITGLTPYEAIRAGTSDAAIFLHQDGEFGVVATGRRADLLLLEKNLLEDVNNISKRVGVMVNGRWFSKQELQQRLMALRNSNQH